VDLDDGVVDVDQHKVVLAGAHQRCLVGEPGQEPRGDRVEPPDVTEGELPQERSQRRGRVRLREHPAHAAVPQQRHVVDAVRAGDHPCDQRGDLEPRVRALVSGHRQALLDQCPKARGIREHNHRDQPCRRHQIRVIEHR